MAGSTAAALLALLIAAASLPLQSQSGCTAGCDLALASYYISPNLNLTYISGLFGLSYNDLLPYNPTILNRDSIQVGDRISVNFPCDCINSDFLGRTFPYITLSEDTYDRVATIIFANLTSTDWLARVNSYPPTRIPDDVVINVTINCSCGDAAVSKDYGLFTIYPLTPADNLSYVASKFALSDDESLLARYNPGANFSAGQGIVYIPSKSEFSLMIIGTG